MSSVKDLFGKIVADPWRQGVGFSEDIDQFHRKLFGGTDTPKDATGLLRDWLRKSGNQPCVFGRLGAFQDLLSFCVLTEDDLSETDEEIQQRIQKARLRWTKEGFEGRKSGFIIWVVSEKLANAEPNATMKDLAARLCSLYLALDDSLAPMDQVLLEEVFLEAVGADRATWVWAAGINFFAAAGDRRWWQDHRIPGGLAFSINSVGHMVKSNQLASAAAAYEKALGVDPSDQLNVKLPDLIAALEMAMKSIDNASQACSGKATRLTPVSDEKAKCPFDLHPKLHGKSVDEYVGYYHTDHTLPSVYFRPDVERPGEVMPFVLDFTYFHKSGSDNPAYTTMGTGRRIRQSDLDAGAGTHPAPSKEDRLHGTRRPIDEFPFLARALAENEQA